MLNIQHYEREASTARTPIDELPSTTTEIALSILSEHVMRARQTVAAHLHYTAFALLHLTLHCTREITLRQSTASLNISRVVIPGT